MPRSSIRFVLLQARNQGDVVRMEERAAFAERLQVDPEQLHQVCLLNDKPRLSDLRGDALLVGGSGEWSVLDDHDGIRRAKDLLSELADIGQPTFASCFGFQLLVDGLGGQVIHDEPNAEVGTFRLQLSEEGKSDMLFGGLPERFYAQLGHKDRAHIMPPGVSNMASSERVPFEALRVGNKPVYAAQFHPELSFARNRGRFERYMDDYGRVFGVVEAERMLREEFHPSGAASGLLDRFVRLFLLDEDPDKVPPLDESGPDL